jgi:hypothetical protein
LAINETDKFERQLFSITLDVTGTLTSTHLISGTRLGVVALEVDAVGIAGGGATVDLKWFQGNTDDITKMSPVIDADANDIETSIVTNEYYLIAEMEGIYLGLELDPLTATAGTLTITGRI